MRSLAGTHGGLLPKSLAANSVLQLTEIKSLPQTVASGIYPVALLDLLNQQFDHYRQNADARRDLAARINTDGPSFVYSVVFVIAAATFLRWRQGNNKARLHTERTLANVVKRCQRRARGRKLPTYAEKERLAHLRKLFQSSTAARWQAYVTWGLALRVNPTKPSLSVLSALAPALAQHAYRLDSKEVARRLVAAPSFAGIEANVYRFRAEDEQRMSEVSLLHFDTLLQELTRRRGLALGQISIRDWK